MSGLTSHRTSENAKSLDGTKTIGQLNRELQEIHDGQPATARCAWCSWTFEGTAAEARDAFAFHRASEHADRVNGASPRELLDRMDRGEPVGSVNGAAEGTTNVTKTAQKTWSADEIIAALQRWAREHDGKPPVSTMWLKKQAGYPSSSTVINRFGSWAKGIAAAGFDKPTRGGPTTSVTPAADPPPKLERKPARVRRAPRAKPPARRTSQVPVLPLVVPGGANAGAFVGECEQAAERHETAAAAYRQIAAGVRQLEELSSR